jgi:hypothetical protein
MAQAKTVHTTRSCRRSSSHESASLVDALPFVRNTTEWWNVKPSGNRTADQATGAEYARRTIEAIRTYETIDRQRPILVDIAQAWATARPEHHALITGFMSVIECELLPMKRPRPRAGEVRSKLER